MQRFSGGVVSVKMDSGGSFVHRNVISRGSALANGNVAMDIALLCIHVPDLQNADPPRIYHFPST